MTTPASEFLKALQIVSGARLAAELGVTPQYVSKVKRRAMTEANFRVEAEWAPVLERLGGGQIERSRLRPDLWEGNGSDCLPKPVSEVLQDWPGGR